MKRTKVHRVDRVRSDAGRHGHVPRQQPAHRVHEAIDHEAYRKQVEFIDSHAPFEIGREEIVVNKAPGTTAPPSLLTAYRKTQKTALSWSISTERAHCPK